MGEVGGSLRGGVDLIGLLGDGEMLGLSFVLWVERGGVGKAGRVGWGLVILLGFRHAVVFVCDGGSWYERAETHVDDGGGSEKFHLRRLPHSYIPGIIDTSI